MRRLVLGCLVLGACVGHIPEPTGADALRAVARWPGTTLASLIRGRTMYIEHCSGCHTLYQPGARAPSAWPAIVKEMSGRARLEDAKSGEVARYLEAMSPAPGAPSFPSR